MGIGNISLISFFFKEDEIETLSKEPVLDCTHKEVGDGNHHFGEKKNINNFIKKEQFQSNPTWVVIGESLFQVESCHFTYITQFTPAQEEQVGFYQHFNNPQGDRGECFLQCFQTSDDISFTSHPSQKHCRSFWFASGFFLSYLSRRILAIFSVLFPQCSAKTTLRRSARSRLARARSRTPSSSATPRL